MRVMSQSPDPLARMHTMTEKKRKSGTIDVKALLAGDEEFLRALVRTALEEVLEAEMTEALGAEKGERTAGRLGYRSGYYGRTLITRIGKLELRVPQDRAGRFSTELFERYQRSERALVAALAEMYVQGVSTRKVKAITEELGVPRDAVSSSIIIARLLGHHGVFRVGANFATTVSHERSIRNPRTVDYPFFLARPVDAPTRSASRYS
jgi:hypothetical protein